MTATWMTSGSLAAGYPIATYFSPPRCIMLQATLISID
jgi:hypothetical protein